MRYIIMFVMVLLIPIIQVHAQQDTCTKYNGTNLVIIQDSVVKHDCASKIDNLLTTTATSKNWTIASYGIHMDSEVFVMTAY